MNVNEHAQKICDARKDAKLRKCSADFLGNFRLKARRLRFAYQGPWPLLGGKSFYFRGLKAAPEGAPESVLEKNAIHLHSPSGRYIKMRGLWDDIRTWFECHHKEYLWIDVDKSYTNSIKKMDEIESDNE